MIRTENVWWMLWFGILGALFGALIVSEAWEETAIERGLAMYCPLDGKWAWKGECDQ